MSLSWLAISLFFRICTSINTKYAHLTPTINTSLEALINILKPNDIIANQTTNTWQILPSNTIGFHLQLSLSHNKWSFHETKTTKIILQITIDSNTTNNNLLLSFSQQNTNKYFITSTIPNLIYPQCNNNNTQTKAKGNIETLLSKNNTNNRISKATNNTYNNISYSSSIIPSILIYTIENIRNNYMQFTSNIDQLSCKYIPMLPHISLNIYIAAIDIGNIFTIKSINITHEIYEPTPSPTELQIFIDDTTTTTTTTNNIFMKITNSTLI
eukprot:21379_1